MQILDPKILILIYSVLGFSSAYFANKEGRNPYLWFFLGIIFGVTSLVLLLFLSYKKRRKKSLIVQEAISALNKQIKLSDSKFWYYLNREDKQIGPMSSTRLHGLFKDGTISKSTYIWNEEFEEWKFLKDTEIYNLFIDNKNAI